MHFTPKQKETFIRLRIISYFVLLLLISTWLYISYLQLYKGRSYYTKSIQNFTRHNTIQGIRGTIYDTNGKILAITKPVIKLVWNKIPRSCSSEDTALIIFLQTKLNINFPDNANDLYKKDGQDTLVLSDQLNFEQLSILLERYPHTSRISLAISTKRSYPKAPQACHIIGYLGANQEHGVAGLEKSFNDLLLGKKGLHETIVNAQGKTVQKKELAQCLPGSTLFTTLDISIQSILEEIFPEHIKGCALILDPETGSIRASISSPRFHPEIFLSSISTETWNKIQENHALINRCTQGLYPPASLFKLVTATAMLEEGYADHTTQWFCSGYIEYRGRKYHCHKRNGHGLINLNKALTYSCNIPFYCSAIAGLSVDTIASYAYMLGLGEQSGISLPESKGLIPTKQWKKKVKDEPWYQGETLSVAIGQGATMLTPLQLARMITGIMNGYLVKPRILESEEVVKSQIPLAPTTRALLKGALFCAISEGTARPLRNLKNWELYPKTGTAQLKAFASNDQTDKHEAVLEQHRHHGWLACYARYKKHPPFVLIILMENVGSSTVAAQHAREFFIKYGKILDHTSS